MNFLIFHENYSHHLLGQEGIFSPIFRGIILSKSLTRLSFNAIITRYKGGQYQVDTSNFRKQIFNLLQHIFIMNYLKVEGDLGRHFLSIRGASDECGISTSSINRMVEKGTYPPKVNITSKRIGFLVYQVEEWLKGKRGGWA